KGFVGMSFLSAFHRLSSAEAIELALDEYYHIDIMVFLKVIPRKDYTCVCKKKWTTIKTKAGFVICPKCKTRQNVRYVLPLLRGDKDNYEKSVLDGIFGVGKVGNDKKVIAGKTTIVGTHRSERVEVVLRPAILEIEE
ncbi:MAG: hypothetical protein QME49_07075, partial [bacterium]|nr:hypothetical protein [bacterium]